MPRYNQTPQDATVVMLPQYREAAVRPYQAGDYTRPSPKAELRQLDRPPSLEFQLLTAGENYGRGHDFFKEQFDRTGITEAAAESRDFYENELAYSNPVLAAVGSTLAGEAFDFWREAATDPINIATAGMGAAPRAALGSGVRSGTLHRAAKLAKAVDDAEMGAKAASEAQITEEYVKALRGMRSRQRELFKESGREVPSFDASEPLQLSAITEALEGGLGRQYDTRAIVAFPETGINKAANAPAFQSSFGYARKFPGISRETGEFHTLVDPQGLTYGGTPARTPHDVNLGLGPIRTFSEDFRSPFNLDPGKTRGLVRPGETVNDLIRAYEGSGAPPDKIWKNLQKDIASGGAGTDYERRPDGLLEKLVREQERGPLIGSPERTWALIQDRLQAGTPAYDVERVGGIGGARKWDSGVPWEVFEPTGTDHGGSFSSTLQNAFSDSRDRAIEAADTYLGPSLIKFYKK